MSKTSILLDVKDLAKQYEEGPVKTPVLESVNLTLHAEERIAILGSSGSGKSTLLHLLGGLDAFNHGEITLDGQAYSSLNDKAMTALRQQKLGFIYQFHHLLPELTALENVMMPLLICKWRISDAKAEAEAILDQVGLSHRLKHKPGELSGGERQRVAVARAIVKKPALILADEPTGNLDQKTAMQVMDLIEKITIENKSSLILVTHDEYFARKMQRTLRMDEGKLVP